LPQDDAEDGDAGREFFAVVFFCPGVSRAASDCWLPPRGSVRARNDLRAASSALGQRIEVEAGIGAGVATTAAHHQVLHGYVAVRRALSKNLSIGIDASVTLNKDSICVTACALEFPNMSAVTIPVSLRLSRVSAGLGPGIFELGHWTGHLAGHLYVGGLAGYADVVLTRVGRGAIIASVRPILALGGARSDLDRVAVVPITIGVRW